MSAKKAKAAKKYLDISQHLELLKKWKSESPRPTSIIYHSHNVTRPNEMTLISAGEVNAEGEGGHLNVSANAQYVQGITDSAKAVLSLWDRTPVCRSYFVTPPKPDIFLVAPSMYRGIAKSIERKIDNSTVVSALRALDRQKEYTLHLSADEDDLDVIAPVLGIRGAEMKILTSAVGLRAASTLAATIRLPPAVNRTGGLVDQLARFIRSHGNPPAAKSAKVFTAVQEALLQIVPTEHMSLIEESKTGIKIIADAPLEWLPVKGLPLGIRYDVSRINSTPGNLFLNQIRNHETLSIPSSAFKEYLVVSMFEDNDPIANYLVEGLQGVQDANRKRIVGKFSKPKNIDEFVRAVSNYHGPILIIDCHGMHADSDGPGSLIIGGQPVDLWSLEGKIRLPPIVILSACDTHPFDRSHATVANGLLLCGAISVVGTSMPIRGVQAARFAARILNRAVHYADIINRAGRAVPWTNIVGGVLRMETATDIIRGFQLKGYYSDAQYSEILLATNMDLNPYRSDWYERLADRLKEYGVDNAEWQKSTLEFIAQSDAIRYVHLGNPESILISDDRVWEYGGAEQDISSFWG